MIKIKHMIITKRTCFKIATLRYAHTLGHGYHAMTALCLPDCSHVGEVEGLGGGSGL